MIKRVEDYTVFRESRRKEEAGVEEGGDARARRKTAEIISLFREAFDDDEGDDSLLHPLDDAQNRRV